MVVLAEQRGHLLTATPHPTPTGGSATPDQIFRVTGPSRHEGAFTLGLEGELDLAGVPLLEHRIQEAVACSPHLVLDLRGLEFIDSSGISAILRAHHRLREPEGSLVCVIDPVTQGGRVGTLIHLEGVVDVREELLPTRFG